MLSNEGDRVTRVVVCPPKTEYFSAADPSAHNILEVADENAAREQHHTLCSVLEGFGAEVITIDELAGHPNSVFVRDTALSTPRGYIKVRMGLHTRRGEELWMANALDAIGEPCAGDIGEPGMVEGGDVILAGRVAFIGLTRRTNAEGGEQLSTLLDDMGYETRSVVLPDDFLHLDQTIGVLGPRRLMCCRGLFPEGFFDGFEVIEVPCHGYNVNFISLEENTIIAPRANPDAVAIARHSGVEVHTIDLSEYAKGAGGPNCLVMPLERA